MTTTPEPEPSEREALARTIFAAPALIQWQGEQYDIADYLIAYGWTIAARPAPVVSAEQVEAAARARGARGNLVSFLAALGVTVADTPAADDEGGQDR